MTYPTSYAGLSGLDYACSLPCCIVSPYWDLGTYCRTHTRQTNCSQSESLNCLYFHREERVWNKSAWGHQPQCRLLGFSPCTWPQERPWESQASTGWGNYEVFMESTRKPLLRNFASDWTLGHTEELLVNVWFWQGTRLCSLSKSPRVWDQLWLLWQLQFCRSSVHLLLLSLSEQMPRHKPTIVMGLGDLQEGQVPQGREGGDSSPGSSLSSWVQHKEFSSPIK